MKPRSTSHDRALTAQARTRRGFLRGAGLALALPFLPSALLRSARAQAAAPRRYVSMYFPNGTADFWRPQGAGPGDAWALSPILEPLAPVKSHLSVLTNVANYATFGGHVEPSHSNCCAAAWTCVKANGEGSRDSGISVDQVIAARYSGQTPLDSIQIGLSTLDSSTDGLPGQHSRSISWKSPSQPIYKVVNPQALFDRLTAGLAQGSADPAALQAARTRRELQKSVLDFVLDDASALHRRLGSVDKRRLDQYLASVRSLELRVSRFADAGVSAGVCRDVARPGATYSVGNMPEGYDRNAHAEIMIDLLVMAFECDITRVGSFMLDDSRSDFVYDFLSERSFSDAGSSEGSGRVAGYHGLQHAGDRNNGFATICHWNAQKASQLAQRLMAVDDGDGSHALDNTVITFASGMHGGNHDPGDVPLALIGGGGLRPSGGTVLKCDWHHDFATEQRLADVHLTLMQHVFGCADTEFGSSSGAISDLLA